MMIVEIRRTTITTASVVPILASGESWESKVDRKVKTLPRYNNGNYYNSDTQNNNVVYPLCCLSSMLCVLYAVCALCCVSSMFCVLHVLCTLCCVSSMLCVLYVVCPLCCVSFMLCVFYVACPLCCVSSMLCVLYVVCPLCCVPVLCVLKGIC